MTDDVLLELSATLGARLKEKGATLTCAESCTGGLIAKVITDISGSSAYFERGYVTYSNQAKHEMLGVTLESLRLYGAVSEAVVNEWHRAHSGLQAQILRFQLAALRGQTAVRQLNLLVPCGLVLRLKMDVHILFVNISLAGVFRYANWRQNLLCVF